MYKALTLLFAVCILQCGCGRQAERVVPAKPLDPAAFKGATAFEEVRDFIAIGPRPAGSPGAESAASHILRKLEAHDIAASIDTFTNETPQGPMVFRNVIGRLPGNAPGLLILASHYDTKRGIGDDFIGANDSGSSTGLLLALGRFLVGVEGSRPEIILAFFDGEECRAQYSRDDGLHGSWRLAKQLVADGTASRVMGVIVLDMVGDRNLSITIPRNATARLVDAVLKAATAAGHRAEFSLLPIAMLDDHVPFLESGIPAVDLIDFQYGSKPGLNDYWHTTADTLDKLSPESLETVGRTVIGVINHLMTPL